MVYCMRQMPMLFSAAYLTVKSVEYIRTADVSICVCVQMHIGRLCILQVQEIRTGTLTYYYEIQI